MSGMCWALRTAPSCLPSPWSGSLTDNQGLKCSRPLRLSPASRLNNEEASGKAEDCCRFRPETWGLSQSSLPLPPHGWGPVELRRPVWMPETPAMPDCTGCQFCLFLLHSGLICQHLMKIFQALALNSPLAACA